METNFNFKSQMCTTVAQSERLLALGLKKDTADMSSVRNLVETTSNGTREVIFTFTPDNWEANSESIPRWSLHRLIEMMPRKIECEVENGLSIDLFHTDYDGVTYYEVIGYYTDKNLYNAVISCITDLIKEGYFNKEYLEE